MADWRIIGLEEQDAFMNAAIDEAAGEAVLKAEVPPTIRFYKWTPNSASIGFFQNMDDELAVAKCEKAGINVVRRKTGGGALFHTAEGEIGYSVIAPEAYFPRGVVDSYSDICAIIVDALFRIGIKAEYKPITDVIFAPEVVDSEGAPLGGYKVSYNAQTRKKGLLMQHGTVLFNPDIRKAKSILKKEKLRMAGVKRINPDLKLDDLYKAMLSAFTYGKSWQEGEWTLAEMMSAQNLVANRYGTVEWNRMR